MDTEKESEKGLEEEPEPALVAILEDTTMEFVVELLASVLVGPSVNQEIELSVPVLRVEAIGEKIASKASVLEIVSSEAGIPALEVHSV